jgi:tetratricopeptide (TPR) repeat protein
MLQNLPWTRATLYGVYKPLVVAALANLVTVLVAYAFNYRSRISEWGTEVRARWTYRKLLMSRLAVLQWLTTIQNVLGALSPLAGTTAMSISRNQFVLLRAIWSLIWSVVSLALIFTLYRSRPRGAVDTASDRSWKFGQYYFNRQDPAIIVPARFAVGHTLNLGQSLAWAIQFTGVLAIIAIFAGRSYVSIPQFSVSQNQYRVRATQSARFRLGGVSVPTTDLGRLDEAVERLKQGDGTAITAIEELTQKNPNDSQILNAAAHGLALSKKELPTARIYAERAVAAKEKEIHSLELGVLSQQDISLERNMAQFWDTLGLVCHRQGDIDCAQRYLVAAWTLSPRTLFATHLAHLEEEQGNYAQAIAHFRQALGAPGSSDQKREIELRLDILDNSKKQTLRQTEQVKQEPKEHPLTHLIRRSNPFYVDLLFQNAVPDGKPVLPLFGHELDQPGPALSEREKAVIAKSMPPFPFPDTGPERVVVRARVTCLKDSRFPFSIRFFTPDEIRDFYRSAASIH